MHTKYKNDRYKKYLSFLLDIGGRKRSKIKNICFIALLAIVPQQIMADTVSFACELEIYQSIDKNLNILNPRSTCEHI